MRSIGSLALALAGGVLLSAGVPVSAQSPTEELLLRRVQELEEKLQRLEEKLERTSPAEPAEATTQAQTPVARAASTVEARAPAATATNAAEAGQPAVQQQLEALDQQLRILSRKQELDQEAAEAKAKDTPVVTAGKDGFSVKSADNAFWLTVDNEAFVGSSATRLSNPNASARKATDVGVSMNWYLNRNIKLQLTYDQTSFEGGAPGGRDQDDEKILFTRLQAHY